MTKSEYIEKTFLELQSCMRPHSGELNKSDTVDIIRKIIDDSEYNIDKELKLDIYKNANKEPKPSCKETIYQLPKLVLDIKDYCDGDAFVLPLGEIVKLKEAGRGNKEREYQRICHVSESPPTQSYIFMEVEPDRDMARRIIYTDNSGDPHFLFYLPELGISDKEHLKSAILSLVNSNMNSLIKGINIGMTRKVNEFRRSLYLDLIDEIQGSQSFPGRDYLIG